eukprot:TRINITY_DN8662_c0_g1_i1.p1 TRINITY_DN8662_c0_g1~~TRINITY_DN8662_c0_g1_i1.p1  ORF type:complete len:724 (+),score=117.45 TRINITY_DN8662_c0_g1_i1:106-2277(+)
MAPQPQAKRRVAVVGSGIAGMSAAYHIASQSKDVEVVIFEKEDSIGGHEMPIKTPFGTVDLGFMVLNHETYPNLMAFYEEHNIPIEPTDMSFAISTPQLSWAFGSGASNLAALLVNPSFWSFVADKSRFHTDARRFLSQCDEATPPPTTMAEFCKEHGYGSSFVDGWLLPFCQAVWSADGKSARDMEAFTILGFLRNHAFLSWQFVQWFTPKGRTSVTLKRFASLFKQHDVTVHTSSPVCGVQRLPEGGVQLHFEHNTTAVFDDVVLATSSGVALQLIRDATADDRRCLGGFRSSSTQLIVHQDTSLMPSQRRLWSSWNVLASKENSELPILSYWVKSIQHVPEEKLFITLNAPSSYLEVKQQDVVHHRQVAHPILDVAAVQSQRLVHREHQGKGGIWYAGAYLHNGFHEDGFRSGIEVARELLRKPSIPLMPVADHFDDPHTVLKGTTTHVRYSPENGRVVHSFSYPLCYDYIDVDVGLHAWWGGLFREDHFGAQEDTLSVAVRKEVARQTGTWPAAAVDMITMPREFGYCFNPITVYLCWSDQARTAVDYVVAEVSNTPWNQRTVHVLPMKEAKMVDGRLQIERLKSLHVSPFNAEPDGDATWRYRFQLPAGKPSSPGWRFALTVELYTSQSCDTKKLSASMDLTSANKRRVWFRNVVPQALQVHFWIHWQAAILFLVKRLSFVPNTTVVGWQAVTRKDFSVYILTVMAVLLAFVFKMTLL